MDRHTGTGNRTRWGRVAVVAASISAAACSSQVDSGLAPLADPEPAGTVAATPATDPTATPTTTGAPPPSTTTTPSTTVPATATSTTTISTTTTTTTTTLLPAPVDPCPRAGSSVWEIRPPSTIEAPPLPDGWATDVVGASVLGREIVALVRPVASPRQRVMVIGGIHGNEPVSPPTVRALVEADVPADIEVWLVPEMNPDGVAAGTRCNANGVDLNRNFSWGWRADDGGPGPVSEPEAQALTSLIERVRPDAVVWVHQPYGYVSSVGPSDDRFEESWSIGSGLPVRPDVTQHGGGESWTALEAGFPSMLIEIDTWSATQDMVDAQRAGFEQLLAVLR